MKKFLSSLVLFVSVMAMLFTITFFIVEPDQVDRNDYMAAMTDKHQRVALISSSKIIFAGGSNIAFGINCETVQNEFSVPVVNLGLHAGLGLRFMINELKSCVKKGDVVFLSIEYLLGADGSYGLKKNTSQLCKEASSYYQTTFKEDILYVFDETRSHVKSFKFKQKEQTNKTEIEVYSREAFNKYGDVVAHLHKEAPDHLNDREALPYRHWEGIELLNEFNQFAASNNIKVCYMYPTYPISEYNRNKKTITSLSNDLHKELKIEIINTPTDFIYPDDYYYDTVYHLNNKGREFRTKQFIEIIKRKPQIINALQAI